MRKAKWGLVLLVLVLGLALLVSGCGGSKDAAKSNSGEKVIKVGFVAPLTGDVKTFGESSRNAFNLALEQAKFKAGD
jgi:branched-chain amino acid transport system substrate-binding protein